MASIRTWIATHLEDHRDSTTGEVDMTALAEDAAREFNRYDGDQPQEILFEWAYQAVRRDEARRSGRITSALSGIINARQADWF